jgi:molybdate transport system ATP-binding protein
MSLPALDVDVELTLDRFSLLCRFRADHEVVVLFGASGAGKSSLLDCIAGHRQPERGRIALAGRTLFSSAERVNLQVRRRRIGYLSQQLALFPHMSVRQNVEYGLLDLPARQRRQRVAAMLERLKIDFLANCRPAAISGGEQQRVALARILVTEPELLLLDEPLAALDLAVKSALLETLFEWQRERAVPMLYVTHQQPEAYSLARRVLLIEQGRIVADGAPREVFLAPLHPEHAALSGYENLLDAVVEAVHPELGTMSCRLAASGLRMEAPLAARAPAEAVRLAVRAGDILLATAKPQGLSARNVICGSIESIADRAGVVEVIVACGGDGNTVPLRIHVTRGAQRELALHTHQPVWLIIKTHSIQLLRAE